MKRYFLSFLLLLLSGHPVFSDYKITRGPAPGEIYFIGPTCTYLGLYHSVDYGQTAVCVDSTFNGYITSITADKTPGVIYYVDMTTSLYRSDNYGMMNSWNVINGDISYCISSGVAEGYIYNAIASHSTDYGVNFMNHACNGLYGSLLYSEIDQQPEVGYCITKDGDDDSLFLHISYNNFQNLSIQNIIKYIGLDNIITRGSLKGELYLSNTSGQILFSDDFGASIIEINRTNYPLYPLYEFARHLVGGHIEGELYVYYRYITDWWISAHIYILHSTDHGVSFDVYHPFAMGEQPLLANFSGKAAGFEVSDILPSLNGDTVYHPAGACPLTVQFCNYSFGDITKYEWDFQNNGTIDSYEAEPSFTFKDTGFYSVRLTIYKGSMDTSSFLRENYVYVYSTTGVPEIEKKHASLMTCYPNPFTGRTDIYYKLDNPSNVSIKIYNVAGQMVSEINSGAQEAGTNRTTFDATGMPAGMYYYSLQVNGKAIGCRKMVIN
jgi:hypothetical protein